MPNSGRSTNLSLIDLRKYFYCGLFMYDPSGKKKTIEDYYDQELRYLNEAGQEFARAFPQRARFLEITQRDDRDPYVERLFEGFAFLTGRVRQKLDDELPELTQSLLGLLWPHFLRPVPPLSILEFQNCLSIAHVSILRDHAGEVKIARF